MSMTKQEVIEMLERFADDHNIPITFWEDEEGTCVSEKKFEFDLTETPMYPRQMIKVCDEQAQSFSIVEDDSELNKEILDQIVGILEPKYPCVFNYDAEDVCLWTCMPVSFSYFEDLPEDNAEFLMLHFFRRSIKCSRIFYNAYKNVTISEMSIEDAVEAAEAEAEENGYEYTYLYNQIRDIVEAKGVRYFIEHIYLPEDFYAHPDGYVNGYKNGDRETRPVFLNIPIDIFDLSHVPEYDRATAEMLVDTDQVKCVHFSIPRCNKEFDCSDIMLVVSDKGNKYFTVEHGGYMPHTAKPVFFLCSWENDCHSNYGICKTRDEAMKKFMKMLEDYR